MFILIIFTAVRSLISGTVPRCVLYCACLVTFVYMYFTGRLCLINIMITPKLQHSPVIKSFYHKCVCESFKVLMNHLTATQIEPLTQALYNVCHSASVTSTFSILSNKNVYSWFILSEHELHLLPFHFL